MIKSLVDGGLAPQECNNADAAVALAQDHPKSSPPSIGYGMRDRSSDGDGPDDDARSPNFEKGGKD